MADLIDRDALLERLGFEYRKIGDVEPNSTFDIILKAPTIEAEPVVYCKDCKHTDTDGCGAIYCKKWDRWEMEHDFYCAYGERKENNGQVN